MREQNDCRQTVAILAINITLGGFLYIDSFVDNKTGNMLKCLSHSVELLL
jgi:hypothetical protein